MLPHTEAVPKHLKIPTTLHGRELQVSMSLDRIFTNHARVCRYPFETFHYIFTPRRWFERWIIAEYLPRQLKAVA